MKRGVIKLDSNLNLDLTFSSGQIFRWKKLNSLWYGISYGSLIILKQRGSEIEYRIQGKMNEEDLFLFLGLDQDYDKILNILSKDLLLHKLTHRYLGLRVLKQNKRECALSFLCAIFNNIKRINMTLDHFAQISKRKLEIGNLALYDYPNPNELRKIDEKTLRNLGLGFRARYFIEFSKTFEDDNDLEQLNKLSTIELESCLMNIKGIGIKTASCIALYSYGRFDSFPIDTWMKKIIARCYKNIGTLLRNLTRNYMTIRDIFNEIFQNHAGYAQLFLYVYSRNYLRR